MASLKELVQQRDLALIECHAKRDAMKEFTGDIMELANLAQESNDLWLEFKRLETEVNNQLVLKQMGDLYGIRQETSNESQKSR